MERVFFRGLAAACGALVISGCQHVAPAPLDLRDEDVTLRARAVDVPPVRDYAAALAAMQDDGAGAFDATDGLSLREGQAVALWYNLDLRVARLEAARAAAVAGAAGRWADPEIGLERGEKSVDEEGGPAGMRNENGDFVREAGGVERSWINAGSLSITIPISGRLAAEKRLRHAEHDVALLRVAEAEWDTLNAVRAAWTRWSVSQARVALLDEHLVLLDRFSEVADSLAGAGELTPTSARLFQIEALRRAAQRDRESHGAAEARVALIEALGLLPDAPVELLPALEVAATTPVDLDTLVAHPRIARLRAAYQAAEDRLRVELRKQYPDLTISPAYADEENETSLVLGLGFPIPVWNANRAGIAAAAASRDIARAQAIAAYQHLIAEAAKAAAAVQGSKAQRKRLLDEVAPAVDEQIDETRALLEVGEIDIVVLYETLGQALESKEELLDATLAEALAAGRLDAASASGAILRDAPVEMDE